jgi:hypothetical protein
MEPGLKRTISDRKCLWSQEYTVKTNVQYNIIKKGKIKTKTRTMKGSLSGHFREETCL